MELDGVEDVSIEAIDEAIGFIYDDIVFDEIEEIVGEPEEC